MAICMCFRYARLNVTVSLSKRKISTRSAGQDFPHLGKQKDRRSSLKLLTNLDVMQRFLYFFKYELLSKQKFISKTCDEVVLLWKSWKIKSLSVTLVM